MARLSCCQCQRALAQCCDLYYPIMYLGNNEGVVCAECAAELLDEKAGDFDKIDGVDIFVVSDECIKNEVAENE